MRRRQTLIGTTFVALLWLAAAPPSRAQDVRQLRNSAWNLDLYAGRTWSAARNSGDRELSTAVEDFYHRVRQFAQRSDNVLNVDALRPQARSLVDQADDIDRMVDRSGASRPARQQWRLTRNAVRDLADVYNLSYRFGRELPRYEEHGRYYDNGGRG
jgi:hypothetical protein